MISPVNILDEFPGCRVNCASIPSDQRNIRLNRTLLKPSSGLMLCSTFDCRIAPCHDE
jgi:hypothetical protein